MARRAGRWLAFIVLVALALLIVAVGALHTDWGRDRVRARIERALDERVAGDVSIGRLEGSVLGKLIVRDVVVRDRAGKPVIALDTVSVDFKLLPLLSQRFEARLVSVLGLELVDRGTLGLLWQPPSDEPTAWSIDVRRFELREGSYVRLRPERAPLRVHDVAVDASLIGSEGAVSLTVQRAIGRWVDGDARGDDLRARIAGRVESFGDRALVTGLELSAGASRLAVPTALASTDGALLAATFRASVAARDLDRFAPQLAWRAPVELVGAVARNGAGTPLYTTVNGQLGTAPLVAGATLDGGALAARLHLRDVRPHLLTPLAPVGRIDLALVLRGHGSSLATLDGSLELDARGSLAGVSASSLSGTVAIRNGELDLTLRTPRLLLGDLSARELSLDASVDDLFGAGAAGRARLSAGELAGPGFRASRVGARTTFSALGLDAEATLGATARNLVAAGERIGRVRLEATLRERGTRVRGALEAGDRDAPYRGRVRFAAVLSAPDADDGPASRAVELTITSARLHTRDLTWTGAAAARVGPGARLHVRRLRLTSEAGSLEASGELRGARDGQLRFETTNLDLRRLTRALPAALELPPLRGVARASGTVSLDPLRLEVRASGRRLAWGRGMPALDAGLRAAVDGERLDATVSAQARALGSATLELEVRMPADPLAPASWRRLRVRAVERARLALRGIHLERVAALAGADIERLGLEGRLRGVLEVSDAGDDITADVRLSGIRGGFLRAPIDLHLEGTSSPSRTEAAVELTLAGTELGSAELALDSGLSALWRPGPRPRVPLRGTLDVPHLLLRDLVAAIDVEQPITGLLCARVHLDGTLAAPALRGRVEVVDARWRMTDLRFASVEGRWRAGGWTAEARAFQRDGGSLHASASAGAGRPLEGQLSASSLDLAVLAPMLRAARAPIHSIDGELGGKVRLRDGTASGTLTVRHGQLAMETGLHRVSGLELTAGFGPRQLTINGSGRTGAGRLRFDATAAMREGSLEPERVSALLRLEDSPIRAGNLRATASGEVRLAGARARDLWRLDVAVSDGQVRLPADFRGSELHSLSALEDVQFASDLRTARGARRDPAPLADATEPRVRARIYTTEPVRIRGEADIEARARADLDVTMLRAATVIDGGVELVSGSITLFDRRYRVARAAVRFEGRSPPNPSVDVLLEHAFEEVTLRIGVTGTVEEPRVELSSDPASYSHGELLGFVLGGSPGAAPRSEDRLQQQAIAAASSFLADKLEELIQRRAPFDTIRLGAEPGTETAAGVSYVTVGRWLSDDLFVAYHRRFDADPDQNLNEALLEYQLSDRWTVRGAAGDRGAAHVELLWVRRYD